VLTEDNDKRMKIRESGNENEEYRDEDGHRMKKRYIRGGYRCTLILWKI